VVGGYAAVGSPAFDWQSWLGPATTQPPPPAPVVLERSLSLPRRGEVALMRARTLAASGHLSDALVTLDLVRPTDPQKADADRLRADIQRQLLALATGDRHRP
jgi:hypothetical protein